MKKSFLIVALTIVSTGVFAQQSTGQKTKEKTVVVKKTAPMKLKHKLAVQPATDQKVRSAATVKAKSATLAKQEKMRRIKSQSAEK